MKVIVFSLVISVVFNLFLMVRLFDVSLSLDYSRSESAINESRSNKLETIIQISLGKMSEENFSEMMDELVDSGFVIKESEGKVVIEGVEVRRKDKQP
ncbi:hypothetical protein [Marinobacter nauticus]|jgi:hypothetical protein|uniref:Uncharacterized protein n=1 Tax=Marinobacter nauticus TaxID=2743 RepID=A0A368V6S6_MARNT|nr:hypothetical protein [Marinobacter nauticus]RBP75694.1 hypothetical protein DET64_103296 [Marinobacter nauticus]RCW36503.1 hypothetical protein DET51_103296 [Marinobacter nauticus]|tara:strand:+ start:537 stop:830 length:294 start_codon:yes stop_codon:yes gene_type:complete